MNRRTFFDLIRAMKQRDRQLIQWAYDIAKVWHKDQFRDDGTRYFEHLRGVALILIAHGYATAMYIVLAILHDLLEDTPFPVSLLEKIFGHVIAREVLTVSKSYCVEDPLTGFGTRCAPREKEEYFASIERNGKRAALAKCADRIYNLTDLSGDDPPKRWTPEKRLKQVAETREWVIPLADKFDPRFATQLRHLCDVIEIKANAQNAAAAIATSSTPPTA